MNKLKAFVFIIWSLLAGSIIAGESDTSGYIKGNLQLDERWERHIYLSYIETIENKYAVSNQMIVASAPINNKGGFNIKLNKVPEDWSLVRMHIVQKGSPKASLIIGGQDENHLFLVLNRKSKIEVYNNLDSAIFSRVSILGAPQMKTFDLINSLKNYAYSLDYDDSLIERRFMEEVIAEKLKLIADTCNNPLVALYAFYQTDFEKDQSFYQTFLSKWENENSSYWVPLKRQVPKSKQSIWLYITILLLFAASVIALFRMIYKRKTTKLKSLTVQERKIFKSLHQGASNQEISDEFNIELSTVKSHVSNIYTKLNVKSRKEAMNVKMK